MSSLISKVKSKLQGKNKDDDDVGVANYNSSTGRSEKAPLGASKSSGQTAGNQAAANNSRTIAPGVSVTGQESGPTDALVVNESDPTWQKARDLTHEAEQASKVSAAKAYEAESYLSSAHDAHKGAQEAMNQHAELAAQAEAERQNIGAADYLHREIDHIKHKKEERENIHVEMNRNLESTRSLVGQKEKELKAVLPAHHDHSKEVDALTAQLGNLQGAKAELENKHGAHTAHLNQLQGQYGQHAQEIKALETEVEQLNNRALELEEQARRARQTADEKARHLANLRKAAGEVSREADQTAKGLNTVERNLQGYDVKLSDLNQKLTASQAAAKDAADLAAVKQAELQLARQQHDAERQKGLPVAKDIERYEHSIHEKEREYTEAQESSKAAKAAHAKYAAAAEKAAKEADALTHAKAEKFETYKQLKSESQAANARGVELWEEAKKHGNTGDANALQRLAEAEKTFEETHGAGSVLNQPLVAPKVGPKQPTTEGPKVHRSETAKESNDNTSKENVRTYE